MYQSKTCAIDGCSRSFHCKGFCVTHYSQFRRHPERFPGPEHFVTMSKRYVRLYESQNWSGLLQEIKDHSTIDENGCWNWTGRIDRGGYGEMTISGFSQKPIGRRFSAHRLAMQCKFEKVLGKQPVHHICRNRKCCNPEHLQLVSQFENVAEMMGRKYMEQRILALESALFDFAPNHGLLQEVGMLKISTIGKD